MQGNAHEMPAYLTTAGQQGPKAERRHGKCVYRTEEVAPGQHAFIAFPERALLDLLYLQPARSLDVYLQELRLQNLERLDPRRLQEFAERSETDKLRRAVDLVLAPRVQEEEAYEIL